MKLNYNSILLLITPFVMVNCQNADYFGDVKNIPNITISTVTETLSTQGTNESYSHKGCYSAEDAKGVCGEDECNDSGKNFYTIHKVDVIKNFDVNGEEKEVKVDGYYHFCCNLHEKVDEELEECVVNEPKLKTIQQYCNIMGAVYDPDNSTCIKTEPLTAFHQCPYYISIDFHGPFEQFKDDTNQICKTIFQAKSPYVDFDHVPFALKAGVKPLYKQNKNNEYDNPCGGNCPPCEGTCEVEYEDDNGIGYFRIGSNANDYCVCTLFIPAPPCSVQCDPNYAIHSPHFPIDTNNGMKEDDFDKEALFTLDPENKRWCRCPNGDPNPVNNNTKNYNCCLGEECLTSGLPKCCKSEAPSVRYPLHYENSYFIEDNEICVLPTEAPLEEETPTASTTTIFSNPTPKTNLWDGTESSCTSNWKTFISIPDEDEDDVISFRHSSNFCCGKHERVDETLKECVVDEKKLKLMQKICKLRNTEYSQDHNGCINNMKTLDTTEKCEEYVNNSVKQIRDEEKSVCITLNIPKMPSRMIPIALKPGVIPLYKDDYYNNLKKCGGNQCHINGETSIGIGTVAKSTGFNRMNLCICYPFIPIHTCSEKCGPENWVTTDYFSLNDIYHNITEDDYDKEARFTIDFRKNSWCQCPKVDPATANNNTKQKGCCTDEECLTSSLTKCCKSENPTVSYDYDYFYFIEDNEFCIKPGTFDPENPTTKNLPKNPSVLVFTPNIINGKIPPSTSIDSTNGIYTVDSITQTTKTIPNTNPSKVLPDIVTKTLPNTNTLKVLPDTTTKTLPNTNTIKTKTLSYSNRSKDVTPTLESLTTTIIRAWTKSINPFSNSTKQVNDRFLTGPTKTLPTTTTDPIIITMIKPTTTTKKICPTTGLVGMVNINCRNKGGKVVIRNNGNCGYDTICLIPCNPYRPTKTLPSHDDAVSQEKQQQQQQSSQYCSCDIDYGTTHYRISTDMDECLKIAQTLSDEEERKEEKSNNIENTCSLITLTVTEKDVITVKEIETITITISNNVESTPEA